MMNTARRIAAIILLQPQLDENYSQVKTAAFDWPAQIEKTPCRERPLCRSALVHASPILERHGGRSLQ